MTPFALTAEDISKDLGGATVLDEVSLRVRRGSVTAILGPSGSGKTTLCRILVGLDIPDRGTITLGESCLLRATGSETSVNARSSTMRHKLGMVFQGYALFPHLSVLENVALAPRVVLRRSKQEARRVALAALERVGLADKADAYPARLSGGQRQRGAIARELAMQREVLFFDEPTSALDPELVDEVLLVIQELTATGLTMVIVTHEVEFARQVADQVEFLDQGHAIFSGSSTDFFESCDHPRVLRFLRRAPAGLLPEDGREADIP